LRISRTGDWLLAIYVVCCASALTWPGYALLGNRIEPYILGVPFSLAWVIGWVMLSFGVLVAYNTWNERRGGGS
jgi:hypothetical protein